jgi:L-threonylcarbamoyladenylate synthase
MDRKGFDAIILEGVDEKGLGLAIMNRIRKAASRRIKA